MFEINKKRYKLSDTNYNKLVSTKHQIVIGHTSSSNMKHILAWKNRNNGEYKNTAPYTIDLDGNIFEHFDPKYYSDYLENKDMNRYIIPVLLENEGWLLKDVKTKKYINWIGDTYDRDEEIFTLKWRNRSIWAPYSTKQQESLVYLLEFLTKKFKIPMKTIGHNTKVDSISDYNGIVFRSNYEKSYTDLSPAFDFENFKNLINKEN